MANFGLRIDLLKLKGAFMRNMKGNTATKRCLIIPIDDCPGIFLGEKGCYLDMTAIQLQDPKFKDTHCIKPDIPKDVREQMTEDSLRSIPILGGLHEIKVEQKQMAVSGSLDNNSFDDKEDLPF